MPPAESPALPPSYSKRSYDFLIERILSGQFRPGDEINRKQVAEQLGVSQAPVNEAVSQLEAEGLLEVAPRRQTRVRVINREEVRALLILREAIECQAARIYCGAPIVQNFEKLMVLAKAVDCTAVGTKENELAEIDFHSALVELVDSPILSEEFLKVMRRKLFHKINVVMPWNVQPSLDSHQDLVQSLRTENPDNAEAAMRHHLERGREKILK